jgi:acetolactate synthase-1/2/3 large subunit
MSQSQETAARSLVRTLVKNGITTFFGVPGGPISPMFDAITSTPGAILIESRHETSSAFEAIGYYTSSGKIPVVVITAGPGATNAITGITSAYLSQIPMLVICGDVSWSSNGGKLLQDTGPEGIDVERMYAKITNKTIRASKASSVVSQGLAALQATKLNKNGPSLFVLPIQLGNAKVQETNIVISSSDEKKGWVPYNTIAETCNILQNAVNPLIVVGNGCKNNVKKVRKLINILKIPFITTPQAKGIIDENHKYSLRHGGLAASLWAREYTSLGIDVALVLGTDLDDCSVGPTQYISSNGKLIHVDNDATVFNRNLNTNLSILGDVGIFSEQLYDKCLSTYDKKDFYKNIEDIKSKSAFDDSNFMFCENLIITPQRAIADIEDAVGDNTIFVSDIGEHMLFALHYLTITGGKSFNIQLNLGSMGSGICSAIGLALGDKTRRVVCVCGDGGMQMNGMSVSTAIKEKLPIIYAVFNDGRYNMVYHGFKQVFGREEKWETPQIDFVKWAESLGCIGVRINKPGEITSSLIDSLTKHNLPIILDIRIDRTMRIKGGGRNEALQHMSMMEKELQ